MMTNKTAYELWLLHISHIHPKLKETVYKTGTTAEQIFNTGGKCIDRSDISDNDLVLIQKSATYKNLEKYTDLLKNVSDTTEVITYFDYMYPDSLRNIKKPPHALYCKGKTILLKKPCVALVGTRSPSSRGEYYAKSLAREFAGQGYTVVGGLSHGIERAAHISSAETGNACAVLANGMNYVYPKEDMELCERICKNGLVISELPPGARQQKYGIIIRNRIIEGLCESIILVEAPEKSGALTSARNALKNGKNVYAVADGTNREECAGNRLLINEGAIPILSPYDIIQRKKTDLSESINMQNNNIQEEKNIDDSDQKYVTDYSLDENEKLILDIITKSVMQFDDIVNESGLATSEVAYTLTTLELYGLIKQGIGRTYSLI